VSFIAAAGGSWDLRGWQTHRSARQNLPQEIPPGAVPFYAPCRSHKHPYRCHDPLVLRLSTSIELLEGTGNDAELMGQFVCVSRASTARHAAGPRSSSHPRTGHSDKPAARRYVGELPLLSTSLTALHGTP
jgi:hypothetical protein